MNILGANHATATEDTGAREKGAVYALAVREKGREVAVPWKSTARDERFGANQVALDLLVDLPQPSEVEGTDMVE
jgi:hypothetical protein